MKNKNAFKTHVGIPVLSVEATNWSLGKKDGFQQRAKTASFPDGTSWHNAHIDNQQYLDKALPGRIERRAREVVRVMMPLVKELARQKSAAKPPNRPGTKKSEYAEISRVFACY